MITKELTKEIIDILDNVSYWETCPEEYRTRIKAIKKQCNIDSVSKRFEIDFDGNVLAGIEINDNEPKVFGAMNGYGNGISLDKCTITERKD